MIHLPGRTACVWVIPGPSPQAEGGHGSIHPAGVSTPPSTRPPGMGTLGGAEKALSHVQGTRTPESRSSGARGCGSARARPRLRERGGRGGGAAGARGAPGFPLCQPPGRWRPPLPGVSGPKCSGCQRLTSPLLAGSGNRGRGHPQKGPERPPAPGLCPSSCTFSPPCPLEFSSFICCPRPSPFQRPICRPPPPPFLFLSIYPPVFGLSSPFLQPHRRQPTRLPRPWDSPGKNTGVGCHFLLQGIFPTQGSNPSLRHSQAGSLLLSYQ